jgi:hypothetical protein
MSHTSGRVQELQNSKAMFISNSTLDVRPHCKSLAVLLITRLRLDLETSRRSPATSLFKFPALALHVWFFMAVRSKSEMLDCLSGILRPAQQQCIRTSRGSQSQLIDGQALSTSLLNSGACRSGKPQSGNVEFWDSEEAVVICDGADHNNGLVFVRLCGVLSCCFRDDTRKRHWRTVDAGHEKAAENDLIEV